MGQIVSRTALEQAVLTYVPPDRELAAKTFLSALSDDELQFLADFFGSSMFATSARSASVWKAVGGVGRRKKDDHHKRMIVAEFASCCGFAVKFR
jgi:hypothetical protein